MNEISGRHRWVSRRSRGSLRPRGSFGRRQDGARTGHEEDRPPPENTKPLGDESGGVPVALSTTVGAGGYFAIFANVFCGIRSPRKRWTH
jgi:hypothetical protein